jgi:hypothetical protein
LKEEDSMYNPDNIIELIFALGIPIIVGTFIYLVVNGKRKIDLFRLKKEILELEIKKDETHINLIKEENKRLDMIIENQQSMK